MTPRWPISSAGATRRGGDSRPRCDAWRRVPPDAAPAGPAAIDFAQVAIQLGRLAEAEVTIRAALRAARGPEAPALRHLLLILLGQQGRIVEARRLIESLWGETAVDAASDRADRLAMAREHVGLDLETFPLEFNLNRFGGENGPLGNDDRLALVLARAYLATRSGDFDRGVAELRGWIRRRPDDPAVWKARLDWAVAAERPDEAREALAHVPTRLLDEVQVLELRAWFARQHGDAKTERQALEDALTIEPGRAAALTRLVELYQQAGDGRAAAELRRRKDALDAALDRYLRLYRENALRRASPGAGVPGGAARPAIRGPRLP